MSEDSIQVEESGRGSSSTGAIDCDVHNNVSSVEALYPYLTDHWLEYVVQHGIRSLETNDYPRGAPLSARPGSYPASGGPPGSDLKLLREQLLDPKGIRYAVLNCVYGVPLIYNEDWAAAMARAVNDWQIAEWLEKEPRLRASIVVANQSPELAAAEIARVGNHPGFVQVMLPVQGMMPLGKRFYWPIYEAATRRGLAVGIYAGGGVGNPTTPVGWPSYYLEHYVGLAGAFQSQVVSLVSEGVITKFPGIKIVLMEGGFTWMPSLMWRLDKNWKGLRREVPWVDRLPSEIIRESIRLTLQPLDEPPNMDHLLQTVDMLGSEEMLLFSTDYPHWHFDEFEDTMPSELSEGLKRRILVDNALTTYRFE